MGIVIPSRYAYDKNCDIALTTIQGDAINNVPSPFEDMVIGVLQKYGFLTLPLLQRAIDLQNKGKAINAQKAVNKMQKQGKVEKYTISYPTDDPDNDVYILSEEIRLERGSKSIFRFDMSNIPYILEHLSLAQWHISVLEGAGSKETALYKQIGQ